MAFPVVAAASNGSGNGSASVPKPSGLAVSDLMVGAMEMYGTNGGSTPDLPSGSWTTLYTDGNAVVGYKIADAGDVAASSFSFNGGTRSGAFILRITGADLTTPIVASSTHSGTGNSMTASGVTPAVQCLFIAIGGAYKGNNGGLTIGSFAIANNNPSWTADISSAGQADTGNQARISASHATTIDTVNAATGTITASSNDASSGYDLTFLAIQPPVVSATTLTFASSVHSPIIFRFIVAASLTLVSTMAVSPSGVIAATWTNVKKGAAAAFINLTKS